MKKIVAGLIVAVSATSAMAWGDREQGALAGIVGTILLQKAMQPQPVYQQQPQMVYQQPQQIYTERQVVYPQVVCWQEAETLPSGNIYIYKKCQKAYQ